MCMHGVLCNQLVQYIEVQYYLKVKLGPPPHLKNGSSAYVGDDNGSNLGSKFPAGGHPSVCCILIILLCMVCRTDELQKERNALT